MSDTAIIKWRPREQQAVDELGSTNVSVAVKRSLVAFFLLVIFLVPVLEAVGDIRANIRKRDELQRAGVPANERSLRRPRVSNLLKLLPSMHDVLAARGLDGWRNLFPRPESLRSFEDDLILNSSVGKVVRPWVQWVLTQFLHVGSQRVQYAKDGWLYYADGVQYAAGPGFLDSAYLKSRGASGGPTDPRPAIYQLHDELKAAGVTLIVVPIPDKATIHPGPLADGTRFSKPLQNSSWPEFLHDLDLHGITYVDLTERMFSADQAGNLQFLKGDTHWSANSVDLAARSIAEQPVLRDSASGKPHPTYHLENLRIRHLNDLVILLDLPPSHAEGIGLYDSSTVARVLDESNRGWQADSTSNVLLIGDSFSDAYSTNDNENLAAGLAEHLSYYLQRPIARRVGRSFGPLDVRNALGATLAAVRTEAVHRKVIIMEFAVRKLTINWWPLFQ